MSSPRWRHRVSILKLDARTLASASVSALVAIIVAGLMVGCELAIAAFVHPTLDELPDEVHLPAASALARVLGSFMPLWYILVFLLPLAEVVIQWHQSGRLPIWIPTSAVLWMLACLYSVTALVPINNRIKLLRLPIGRRTSVDGICFTVGVLYSSR
jgi:uncharacterized membrane protein